MHTQPEPDVTQGSFGAAFFFFFALLKAYNEYNNNKKKNHPEIFLLPGLDTGC